MEKPKIKKIVICLNFDRLSFSFYFMSLEEGNIPVIQAIMLSNNMHINIRN